MNLKLIVATCMFVLPLCLSAQRQGPGSLKAESRDRIEAQRVAFITQKLNLSPDEAAKFWPIYNEHKDALKDMRDDIERPDLMSVSDDEANGVIERHLQQEQKRLDMKRALYVKLRTVIGPRKILLLHATEKEFNRELLRRANSTRGK